MGARASSSVSGKKLLNFGELVYLNRSSIVEVRWTIRDFSFHCENIYCVKSPPFASENGELWIMAVFPYGATPESNGFVSIYVVPVIDTNVMHVNLKGQLRSQSGYFGNSKFMSRNEFLNKLEGYNNELVMNCNIKCMDQILRKYIVNLKLSHNYKTSVFESVSVLELLRDFGELLKNSELSDVDLLAADGKLFKVHKVVLASRSKVFLAMFQNNMLEHQTSFVKIKDFDGSVVEQVLQFIYTTKSKINDDNAKDVLLAADKYDIGGLKRECIDYLRNSINVSNAVELLEFAEKYEVSDLTVKAQIFIAENAKDITEQPDFDLASLNAEAVNRLFRQMAIKSK